MIDLEDRAKVDFYETEDSLVAFTERYHVNRGYCCGSGCRHCPFLPRGGKGGRRVDPALAAVLGESPAAKTST